MSQTQVAHSDSIDSQDPHKDGADKKAKSRRPPSKITQLRRISSLPTLDIARHLTWSRHCVSTTKIKGLAVSPDFGGRAGVDCFNADIYYLRPILTPKTVLPLFFAVGIIFAPIGGLLLWTSAKVREPHRYSRDVLTLLVPHRSKNSA
jgi:hypothetical protein